MANYIVLDTETTNSLDDPFCYDISWLVVNVDNGKTIVERSFVVADIFLDEKELMKEAFFADKIPQYWEAIKSKEKTLKKLYNIRRELFADILEFNIEGIVAHNSRFDYNSLNTTQRYLTNSKYRYFLPYNLPIIDSLALSRKAFSNEDYKSFCLENGFCYGKNHNIPRYTAEVLHRYLTNNLTFEEEHKGLEDCRIEKDIFLECIKRLGFGVLAPMERE